MLRVEGKAFYLLTPSDDETRPILRPGRPSVEHARIRASREEMRKFATARRVRRACWPRPRRSTQRLPTRSR